MRVEILFLRWLAIIALGTLAFLYFRMPYRAAQTPPYQAIPIIQDGKSSGHKLTGVVVDPDQRNVYAIVGGPAHKKATANDFCLVWKGEAGKFYGTTFSREKSGGRLIEINPEDLSPGSASPTATPQDPTTIASAENTIRSVVESLSRVQPR